MTEQTFSRFDVETFKREAADLSAKLNDISISSFKRHVCVDCGKQLSKIRFTRCKSCNMKRVGRANKK